MYNTDQLIHDINSYKSVFGRKFLIRLGKCDFIKQSRDAARAAETPMDGSQLYEQFNLRKLPPVILAQTGLTMEATKDALKAISNEVLEARNMLQSIFNELVKTHSLLIPEMILLTKDIRGRQAEMKIEVNESLTMMKDVRQFFLDKDHKVEMERLKEFIKVCQDLKVLIDDGTLGAVVNAIPKLGG